ncbi:ATP-binding protein [Acetobacterium sp.]|uniref:ATP-binding protein n=1 Tax=Acetobacterium sp. TaxID=1872094 RepID=UPI0035946109
MCKKNDREDMSIVKTFVDEWMTCFNNLEKEILKLELYSKDMDITNTLLDDIHCIKSGSSFIGLSSITRLCFEIETILKALENDEITVKTELIDSLLLFLDFFKAYLVKLNEIIKKKYFTVEDDALYLEIQDENQRNQVHHSLKLAFENCQVKEPEENRSQEQGSEDVNLDILQSEEFKCGLEEGIHEQFQLENLEHIEKIENDLLMRLDSNSADREAINEIFRAVHSIKGGTGIYLTVLNPQSTLYMRLKQFSEIVHSYESLLALIRDKECQFENTLVDLSFFVMDYLKSFISAIDSEKFEELGDQDILDKIKQQLIDLQSLNSAGENKPLVTQQKAPKTESEAEEVQSKNNVTQSIRVNQDKLDKMMNMISELLIAKNSFMHISSKLDMDYDLPQISKEVKEVGGYVNRISDDLQNTIMSIRMVEVKTVFQKMPRVIRDIAQSSGKKIELILQGENTEIDKTIIEQISDPLVHLIRNSADHGIESLEDRLLKGKPETGKIVLRAYNKNKQVYIEIEDDGKGIDPEKVKKKAIEKGIVSQVEVDKMSRNQLINLIFLPGFSMAKEITEVSGRGVGMDIVKSNISKINGKVTIESEVDKGTKMIVQLPLSLAVSHGLIVEVDHETYIFPLDNIVETVKIKRNMIHEFNGKFFTYLRGEAIGIEWLSKIFSTGERDHEKEELNAVILSDGFENYAIVVDKLRNEQEFVVKTLAGHLAAIPGITGSTLLGNGQVVLIVNPVDLLQLTKEKS